MGGLGFVFGIVGVGVCVSGGEERLIFFIAVGVMVGRALFFEGSLD